MVRGWAGDWFNRATFAFTGQQETGDLFYAAAHLRRVRAGIDITFQIRLEG